MSYEYSYVQQYQVDDLSLNAYLLPAVYMAYLKEQNGKRRKKKTRKKKQNKGKAV